LGKSGLADDAFAGTAVILVKPVIDRSIRRETGQAS